MTIIGAIAGLASIAKVLYDIISDVSEGHKIKKLTESHQDMMRVTKEEFDQFLSLSDLTYANFDAFRHVVCENFSLDINREARIISDHIISEYVSTTQNEIFHILSNRIPDTFDFLRDFNSFCQDINSDSEFCKKLTFSNMVEFTNSKLYLEEKSNTLILRTKVRMPILAEDYPSKKLSLFRTLNIGYFDNNQNLAKLVLPKLVIKTDSTVYGMNEKCDNGICFMNSLSRNSKSICAQNVFAGTTENCHVEMSSEEQVCDFTQIPGLGTIATVSQGRFSEISEDLISVSTNIDKTTVFFEKDGQLECFRETGLSFHRLVTHRAAKFSLRVPEIISLPVDISEMKIIDNNQEKYFETVNHLKKFHDDEYFKLGQFEISDDSVVCYSVISILIVLLLVLFGLQTRTRKILMKIPNSVLRNLK